ncbi:MAG TPA: hypothetical protein VIQ23_02300 [Hanamia sp.]
MSFEKYFDRFRHLDSLIRLKATGDIKSLERKLELKFIFKKLSYSILSIIVLTTSCNTIKESNYAKTNLTKQGFYTHYFNDSLKLYIRFLGGHQIANPPLANYNKHTPKTIKTFLKRELKHTRKNKILFYSFSPWKEFGFFYIGFLHENSSDHDSFQKMESVNHSVFFEKNGIEKINTFLLKRYIIPLGQKELSFYLFKKILYRQSIDSSTLQSDTHSELMTLKTLSVFKPYGKTTKDFSDSINEASRLPGYSTSLNALLELQNKNKDKAYLNLLDQSLFWAYAAFDEVDTIKQLLYEQRTFKGNNIKNRSSDTVVVNNQFAIDKIVQEAVRQKVIMINESHYDWRHRYFVTLLLDSLYKKGYTYLCMEALDNPTGINQRKFPTSEDGFYMKEPFMANLARTALNTGYQLIAYDDTTDRVDENLFNSPVDKREYNQALNLYRHYKKDTAAKWLVYAGYSHINKLQFSTTESSTMAKYFSELSHVNPYSINQSVYCDIFNNKEPIDSPGSDENYYYLRNSQINDSMLLKQSDLYVINNIDTIPYEKMNSGNGYKPYKLHYEVGENSRDGYAVQVFLKKEYDQSHDAIPVYIKRGFENIFNKTIWLPKNNYYFLVTDINDKILFQKTLIEE